MRENGDRKGGKNGAREGVREKGDREGGRENGDRERGVG